MVVIAAWVVYAGLRRIIEWRTGGGFALLVDVVPFLLSFAPAIMLLHSGWQRVNPVMRVLAWCWIGTYGYGFLVGLASGNGLPTIASLLQFTVPLVFGLWLSSIGIADPRFFDRVAGFMLWCGTLASIYGIAQYVYPFPWDADWVLNSGLTSIGSPVPFGLRIFSVMSSAEPFGDFLTVVLLLNLPRLRASPLPLAQFVCCTFALLLTQVRADWIGLGIGVLFYVCCTGRRWNVLQNVGAIIAVSVLIGGALPVLLGTERTSQSLQQRFESLSDISTDASTASRLRQTQEGLSEAMSHPAGAGLGVLGTATQVGAKRQTTGLDNGYVARFVELGYPGLIGYLGTIIFALAVALRRSLTRDSWPAIAGGAVQLALIWLDVSSDHHNSFTGVVFWLAVAATLPVATRSPAERTSVEAVPRIVPARLFGRR